MSSIPIISSLCHIPKNSISACPWSSHCIPKCYLIDDKNEIDDDIEEGLAEYHEGDEDCEQQAASEVEAQLGSA